MKKMSSKKLLLSRETLRKLTAQEALQAAGGLTAKCTNTCDTCYCETSKLC
jgi:hypothetical protein